ncbi:unnamed protein product [Phytomonas sp. Hart1]|nr:unnamed protein product [Phytomonas sp. Hart1]|eukprot:CCW70247.1 unnamed protein product [Phytomonas sp. isolate Hart1]
MSTSTLSQPSSISSLCSSFSSYVSISAERIKKLVNLLTRPRENGGYGGKINYHEFSLLGHSFNWNREMIEDCWYDVLCGVPTSEATDMQHMAEVMCDYCSPAALESSMIPPAPPHLGNPELAEGPPKSVISSQDDGPVDGLLSLVPPVLIHADAGVRSSLFPKTGSGNTDRRALFKQGNKEQDSNTSRFIKPMRRSSKLTPRRNRSPVSKRYALQTASSELKLRAQGPSLEASADDGSAPRRPSPRKTKQPPQTSTPQHSAVFDRLYTHGKKLQLERKAWIKPLEWMPSFRPHITPYRGRCPSEEENGDAPHYHRVTRSYCAKLVKQPDRPHDPLDDTPTTARVDFRPPPGPSSFVPPGYIEGVARLRRGVASRQHRDFAAGLRQDLCSYPCRDGPPAAATQYPETPILRLPLFTIEKGAKESVDVRLASHDDRVSCSSNNAYIDGKVPLATTTKPRSFSALSSRASYSERFKAH